MCLKYFSSFSRIIRVSALQNDRPYKKTVHINHVVAQVPFVVETYSFYYVWKKKHYLTISKEW